MIMKSLSFISFLQALLILNTGIARTETGNMNNGLPESSGPAWVKQQLTESGAYEIPAWSFTTEYDAYKTYPNLKGIFFEALPYHGKPTKVFAWYGVPEGTQPGEKLPAVLLVHGGGGTVFPDWVKIWNDHGYIAISIALEGQAPGVKDANAPLPLWPTHPDSGPYRTGFFADVQADSLQDQWFYHAVADVILAHNLLRSFPEVDTSKIGITGISWGGILTNVITGLDNRLAFTIPVYGCGYLHETPLYSRQLSALTPDAQTFYLDNWEPSLYIPLQNAPALFVNGTNDCHFTMNSFTRSFLSSPNEKYLRVEHNMVHGHAPGWNPSSIYYFADYITRGDIPPIKFSTSVLEKNGMLSYSYLGNMEEAFIYYTVDTSDWDCKNYEWKEVFANINLAETLITGRLPSGALYYFVNGITSGGMLFSSPMQKVAFEIEDADTSVLNRDPLLAKDSVFFSYIPDVPVALTPAASGTTSFTTEFSSSGSSWQEQCIEEDVFLARLTSQDNGSALWDLRIGKGGQIYSFLGPYGEGIPPQYRSWDFNTARWVDDVWQTVNVATSLNNADSFTPEPGTYLGRPEVAGLKYFIHSAGVYMNDPIFLTIKPFYSPQMASWFDEQNRSFTTMHWGQQAHIPNIHKAEVLNTTRYKDLGNGVLEATYVSSNVGEVTVNRHNMPWGGVRASSLPQCWLSKPDNSLERSYATFGGTDNGVLSSIDLSGGYFIWAAEGDDENRPAMALVFGKDRHLNEYKTEFNMGSTQLRWGDGSANLVRDYSVFTVISVIDIPQGRSFFYRLYYVSGSMKEVHERAIALSETSDYGIISIDPQDSPLTKIHTSEFGNAFAGDIKLFSQPVNNMVPLFLMENTETGNVYISPDLYYDVNAAPFINPYQPGDPKYETYQDQVVYKPYDGKIKYKRLLGYGVLKEQVITNIRFALLDSLILDTSKVILPPHFKDKIWIPLEPCFDCAWQESPSEQQSIILYNDFGDNQYVPWSDPINLAFSDRKANPDPSGINPDPLVGKVVRGTGTHANVRFQLADYLDLSLFNTFKVNVFYEGGETVPVGCNIRLILRNNGLGTTQYALTQEIKRSNAWDEYVFDCSGAVGKDSYNQAWLFFFSPDDGGIAAGEVFYIDDLKGPPLTMNGNLLDIYTNEEGSKIVIDFSRGGYDLKDVDKAVFRISRDAAEEEIPYTAFSFDSAHIFLEGLAGLSGRDKLKLSFISGEISDSLGRILPYFSDGQVQNNIPLTSFIVTFRVTDGSLALPDALVSFNNLSELTDNLGEVVFEDIGPAGNYSFEVTKAGFDAFPGSFHLSSDTAIQVALSLLIHADQLGSERISLFPNPVSDLLYLTTEKEMETVEILDISGKLIKQYKPGNISSYIIDAGELDDGLYMIRIGYGDHTRSTGRFAVLR